MSLKEEIEHRRTFAIISHPDAGKTTLTEKFLLYGGAIQTAGAVKSNNIGLLMTFQKVFQLDRPSAVFAPARQTLDRELGG